MVRESFKVTRTISVPLELEMFNTIHSLASSERVPLTTIVRRALYKQYMPTELLEN